MDEDKIMPVRTEQQQDLEYATQRWHADRAVSDTGINFDDHGEYVEYAARCAPGLGWPLTDRPRRPIDPEYVRAVLAARVRRLLGEKGPQ